MPSRQKKRCQTNGEAAQIGREQRIQIIRVDNRPESVQRRVRSIVLRVEVIKEGKKKKRENEEERAPGLKESSQKEEVEEGWMDGSMGGSC